MRIWKASKRTRRLVREKKIKFINRFGNCICLVFSFVSQKTSRLIQFYIYFLRYISFYDTMKTKIENFLTPTKKKVISRRQK